MIMELIFWLSLIIVIYAYFGYPFILLVINLAGRVLRNPKVKEDILTYPDITLIIPAYNERENLPAKIRNIEQLDYPEDRLSIIWLTDGSNDGSNSYLKSNIGHKVLRNKERLGKSRAINEAMKEVNTQFVVFTDANTLLNRNALKAIAKEFRDRSTGCVSGEKRINVPGPGNAVSTGEGTYWKYESFIKRLESDLKTAIGGAGEVLCIRKDLYLEPDPDIINDDFYISLMIIKQGYNIKYCPDAYAIELPSLSIREEFKRKKRIAAGGMQLFLRNLDLLNIFKYKFYAFQYFSHKALRWTIVPVLFFLTLIMNIIIIGSNGFGKDIYSFMLLLQAGFYFTAVIGAILRGIKMKAGFIFLPYYLIIMNISNLIGALEYIGGIKQHIWEKSERMT